MNVSDDGVSISYKYYKLLLTVNNNRFTADIFHNSHMWHSACAAICWWRVSAILYSCHGIFSFTKICVDFRVSLANSIRDNDVFNLLIRWAGFDLKLAPTNKCVIHLGPILSHSLITIIINCERNYVFAQ